MAAPRGARRKGSPAPSLERARELLRVVTEAHAAYAARLEALPPEEAEEAGGWGHYGRGVLLPGIGAALDELEAGAERSSNLRVVEGEIRHGIARRDYPSEEAWDAALEAWQAEGEAYRLAHPGGSPMHRATLGELVAWLEAVTGPEPSPEDVALVSWEPDYGIMLAASSYRVPEADSVAVAPAPLPAPGAPLTAAMLGLQRANPATVALETTLARAPVFSASSVRQGLQLELGLWRTTGSLYGHPFRVLEPNGPLTVRDALGLSHLIRRWADSGYPESRRVLASENEAVGWFGYSTTGGRQRGLLRESLGRLRATTFQSSSRVQAGRSDTLIWGLLDYARTPRTGPEGRVSVTLSEPLSYLVRAGGMTYLDGPTFAALVAEDELAARLWVFLESEQLPRRYRLYSAPEGEPEAERDTPAIASLLRLSGWTERRGVARRVRQAAQVLERVDSRYRLAVEPAPRQRGMWTLNAGARVGTAGRQTGVLRDTQPGTAGHARGVLRDTHPRSKQGGTTVSLPSVLPKEKRARRAEPLQRHPRHDGRGVPAPSWDASGSVMDAWRTRYPRPPTLRQLAVLAELVAENDAPGIARALLDAPAGADALGHVMGRDRADTAALAREEERREREASRMKRHGSGLSAIGAALQAPVPRASVEPPAEDAETRARRRAQAVALLREGLLEGSTAARYREEYGITEDELGHRA